MSGVEGSSSCGACRFLRRRCAIDCVFAPYFCYDEATTHFAAVHKVFGASNVSRQLLNLPANHRIDAAIAICYEALARMEDPVYGCVAHIFALQGQITSLQEEIDMLRNLMATPDAVGDIACHRSHALIANHVPEIPPLVSPQLDSMNAQPFQDQSVALVVSHEGSAPAYQELDSQVSAHFTPAVEWEDHLFGDQFRQGPRAVERVFEGIDQDIFACDPWFVI